MTTLQAIAARYSVSLTDRSPIPLPATRSDLPRLCQSLGMRRGAEVGVWKGAYSEEFCRAIPGIDWTCVDPWAPYADYREAKNDAAMIAQAYQEAQIRLKPFGCTFLKVSSREAAESIEDGSLDVCYIDGNHEAEFVREDLEIWTRKVRPGGILAGHDYRVPPAAKSFIQVKVAVDAYVSDHAIAPWFVLVGDKTPSFLWVIQ